MWKAFIQACIYGTSTFLGGFAIGNTIAAIAASIADPAPVSQLLLVLRFSPSIVAAGGAIFLFNLEYVLDAWTRSRRSE